VKGNQQCAKYGRREGVIQAGEQKQADGEQQEPAEEGASGSSNEGSDRSQSPPARVPSLEIKKARQRVLPKKRVPRNLSSTRGSEPVCDQGVRVEEHSVAGRFQSTTQVDILEVEEIAFVEWTIGGHCGAA